jgi:hypothetical protein
VHAPGTHFVRLGALALLAAACAASVGAQDDVNRQQTIKVEPPNAVQACVYHPSIDHTRILDDRNILFFMRDHSIYQNTLKEQCFGLKSTKRFAYGEASMHRLCTGNLITVLEDLTPGGVSRNNVCKLGMFVPVDNDAVEDLIAAAEPARKKEGDRRQAIKVVPVELPPPAGSPPAPVDASAPPPRVAEPTPAAKSDR